MKKVKWYTVLLLRMTCHIKSLYESFVAIHSKQRAQAIWHLCVNCWLWLRWDSQAVSDRPIRNLPCLEGQWLCSLFSCYTCTTSTLSVWNWWIISFCVFMGGNNQANAIGRSAKTVREFLEKNYTDEAIAGDNEAIKLAIKALLEVRSTWTKYYNLHTVICYIYRKWMTKLLHSLLPLLHTFPF